MDADALSAWKSQNIEEKANTTSSKGKQSQQIKNLQPDPLQRKSTMAANNNE